MSRNNSGVYSLPSGNPVYAGYYLTDTLWNNTLSDIATELTASVPSASGVSKTVDSNLTFSTAPTFNQGIGLVREDKSGTPGNCTLGSTTRGGKAAFAAGANSVVVTATPVTTSSIILVQLQSADATLTRVTVTPGSGSFTVTGNANATATTIFSFVIL